MVTSTSLQTTTIDSLIEAISKSTLCCGTKNKLVKNTLNLHIDTSLITKMKETYQIHYQEHL